MIQCFSLNRLSHEELRAFAARVNELLSSATQSNLRKLASDFQEASSEFEVAVQNTPELLALEIQAKDTAVDEAWRGLNTELENNLDHPNEHKREASSQVYDIWAEFGDPTELPFDEEYSTIAKILDAVSNIPRDVLVAAAVDEWFDALQERYRSFIGLWGAEGKSDAQRIARQLKQTRSALEAAYDELISWANCWFIYEDDAWFKKFDVDLNEEIVRIKEGQKCNCSAATT